MNVNELIKDNKARIETLMSMVESTSINSQARLLEVSLREGFVSKLSTIEYSHAIPLTAHEKITAELFDTYKRKNHDYGDSFTESLNEFGLVAGLVRVGDKVNRLKSLTKNEQRVNDESLRDTILDASNYLVMMAMWLDSEDDHG